MTALEKQMEAARKNLEKFTRNREVYRGRADKYIAAEVKKGIPVSREDFRWVKGRFGYEVVVNPEKKDLMQWEDMYRIANNLQFEFENAQKITETTGRLETLQKKQQLVEQQRMQKEALADKSLEAELNRVLEPFRKVLEENWRGQLENHYTFIKERCPGAVCEYRELEDRSWQELRTHGTSIEYTRLKNRMKGLLSVINDKANKYGDMQDYVKDGITEWNGHYHRSMERLTEKCCGFGIDSSRLDVTAVGLGDKGLEVIVRDGKPRQVYARVILAAEYSDKVSEHFRYIVTERQDSREKTIPQDTDNQNMNKTFRR